MNVLLLVVALVAFVKGEWDPDDPADCSYVRILYSAYAVDTCNGAYDDLVEDGGGYEFKCGKEDDGSDAEYIAYEKEDCSGDSESLDLSDYLAIINIGWEDFSEVYCGGSTCSATIREYSPDNEADYGDDSCPGKDWEETAVATDVCASYGGYGYVYECDGKTVTYTAYMDDDCTDVWYTQTLEDDCNNIGNGTDYYVKYEITCPAPALTHFLSFVAALLFAAFAQ